MDFKQLLLNSQEKLEKNLNQLILFISRQKRHFIITAVIFLKHIITPTVYTIQIN